MKKILFLTTMLLLISVPAIAQNDAPKTVAVWETKCSDNSITSFQSTMVRGSFETAIANAPGYAAYDRTAFDQILKEHDFQRSGAVADNQIISMGELVGVQYIIVPEAQSEGETFYIMVKMLDVESGKYGAAYDALCTTSLNDIRTTCINLGAKLFGSTVNRQEERKNEELEKQKREEDLVNRPWTELLKKVMTNVTERYSDGCYIGGCGSNSKCMGLLYWNSGVLYCGEIKNGTPDGNGMMILLNEKDFLNHCPGGQVYIGSFKDGQKNGSKGRIYTIKGNLKYVGKFKNDKPTGSYPSSVNDLFWAATDWSFKIINMPNGDKYIGGYFMDKKTEYGLYIWENGDAWYGSWDEDDRKGPGIQMYYNGGCTVDTW